jgi:hypothetical protein
LELNMPLLFPKGWSYFIALVAGVSVPTHASPAYNGDVKVPACRGSFRLYTSNIMGIEFEVFNCAEEQHDYACKL